MQKRSAKSVRNMINASKTILTVIRPSCVTKSQLVIEKERKPFKNFVNSMLRKLRI
jgi:hypothetical protein